MSTRAILLAALLVAGSAVAVDAAPTDRSPADLNFLASIAPPGAGVPSIGTPTPQPTTCTISSGCGDGNTAACSGNFSCEITQAGVKCDGNEVQCPNYCEVAMSCQCCDGALIVSCVSRIAPCEHTSGGISCGGSEITCEDACPICPDWPPQEM